MGIKRGLVVGRFQPYHRGHHEAVKNILGEMDELVIAVGSTEQSHEIDNPFTAGERVEMIAMALKADGIYERCYIVPVPDIREYALWVNRVRSYCPHFDVVYTNNPLVRELFSAENIEVRKMASGVKEVESSAIRKAFQNGNKWEDLVPKSVREFLEKIGAQARIMALIEEEKKE